jgi:hypothetical protein
LPKYANNQPLNRDQAAECAGYSRETMRRWMAKGYLPNSATWTPDQIREALKAIPPKTVKAKGVAKRATTTTATEDATTRQVTPQDATLRHVTPSYATPSLPKDGEGRPVPEPASSTSILKGAARIAEHPNDLVLPPGPPPSSLPDAPQPRDEGEAPLSTEGPDGPGETPVAESKPKEDPKAKAEEKPERPKEKPAATGEAAPAEEGFFESWKAFWS